MEMTGLRSHFITAVCDFSSMNFCVYLIRRTTLIASLLHSSFIWRIFSAVNSHVSNDRFNRKEFWRNRMCGLFYAIIPAFSWYQVSWSV